MLVVAVVEQENPEIREEDYTAAMMAIQNLSLASVALGLGKEVDVDFFFGVERAVESRGTHRQISDAAQRFPDIIGVEFLPAIALDMRQQIDLRLLCRRPRQRLGLAEADPAGAVKETASPPDGLANAPARADVTP